VERDELIQLALKEQNLDVLVCGLPSHVLMLTGYWPVIGVSVAVVARDGDIELIVPEDEEELAEKSWADDVKTFTPQSLDRITHASEAIRPILHATMAKYKGKARVGFESGEFMQPAPYVSMHLYQESLSDLLCTMLDSGQMVPASEMLEQIKAVKTRAEIQHIRTACRIAATAYAEGAQKLLPGVPERAAAAVFRIPLMIPSTEALKICRCDGFAFCMSGVNAAKAYGAYAWSRVRLIEKGDLAMVHVNSYVDGYWTDVTRTYSIGAPDATQIKMYKAVFAAREAALAAVKPGVRAAHVDAAARDVLDEHGFGSAFKHPTGHGTGFVAIDHNARPRLHPKSEDVIQAGMVFSIEPGVYIEGYGGLRHCDMVAVTDTGAEVLTPFHSRVEELTINVL
jgi:Xaa-Pro aminopeptidase/Xaa-Pro dipeptidase